MRRYTLKAILATLGAALATVLTACGGGEDGGSAPPPSPGLALIGPAGGEVSGPDGVKLVVPSGALGSAITLRIARDGTGAPELGGAKAISPVYSITPHGTAFAESARISIPFNSADVAPGTKPVLLRAQPGGGWEALATDVLGGSVSAADTPGLSYYAVGTCYTTRDASIPGPDPLLYCPGAHTLQLTLLDANRAAVPVPRNSGGVAQPALSISAPTVLTYTLSWTRPAGTQRSDHVWMQIVDAGLLPAQQPLSDLAVNRDYSQTFTTMIDPATVPGAGVTGGKVIRLKASVDYTTDAFYPGCVCFKPATWTFSTEIPVRVTYTGTAPVITQQPVNVAVIEGQTATFAVSASGPNLSAVWQRGRGAAPNDLPATVVPMPNGVASFTIPSTSVAGHDGWAYSAEVCSNREVAALRRCVLSNAAVLSVAPVVVAPVFTTQPASISVTAGQTASFTAVATGQPAPTIGWSRLVGNGAFTLPDPICSVTTGSAGRTSATCTTAPLTLADSGMRIQANASNGPNGANSVNSAIATITVLPQPVAPSITTPAEPADRTVQEGGSVTWTVGAGGSAPLSYAWRTQAPNGSVLNGITCTGGYSVAQATAATVTLAGIPLACTGHRFFVVVSNGTNPAAESRRALLTVTAAPAAPTITSGLTNRSVVEGTQVTFNVAATGLPAAFTYTWTLGGLAIPNAVSGCGLGDAACTFTAQLTDSGRIVAVRVANGTTPDATSSATLTVTSTDVAASITSQPVSQSVAAGDSATFTVGVAGTPTPGVIWQTSTDGLTWSNAGAGSTLTLAGVALAQNGLRVRAIASNTIRIPGGGTQTSSVTSNEARLFVGAGDSAYEGFDYPLGDWLAGKSGGTGWGGAWEVADGTTGVPVATTQSGAIVAGLEYTDANGRQLLTSPGAWQTDATIGSSIGATARRLTSARFGTPGSTRWVSFLLKQASDAAPANIAAVTLGADARLGLTGPAMAGITDGLSPFIGGLFNRSSNQPIPGYGPGVVVMVLVRVDFGATGDADTMSMWINPPLDPAVPLGTPTFGGFGYFADSLGGLSLLYGTLRSFTFDELRTAPTREGVSPMR